MTFLTSTAKRKTSMPQLTQLAKRRKRIQTLKAYLFLAPIIPFILAFDYFPFLQTFIYSLSTVSSRGEIIKFVGLQNYIEIFSRKEFLNSIFVTLKFTAMYVPLSIICPLLLALIASQKRPLSNVYQLMYSIPMAVSMSATCLIFEYLLTRNGLLNHLLNLLGITSNSTGIDWLGNPTWALPSLVMISVWTLMGFDFMLLLAAIRNVPQELSEASVIDGAGYWKKTFNVTIPMITPTLFFVTCTNIVTGLTMVAPVMILTQGDPLGQTSTLTYYIYTAGFRSLNYTLGSTASIIAFLLTLVFLLVNFLYEKRGVVYE